MDWDFGGGRNLLGMSAAEDPVAPKFNGGSSLPSATARMPEGNP